MPSITQRLALIVLAVIAMAGAARADHSLDKPKSAEARDHLKAGFALYNRAQWQAAAVEYRAGAAIEDAPIFDFNLGQCFRFAGDYQQALTHYERFMDRGAPTGKILDSVQGFVADMRAQLERARELRPVEAMPKTESGGPAEAAAPPVSPPRVAEPPPPPPVSATAWRYVGWGMTAASLVGGGATAYLALDARSANNDAKDVARPTSERLAANDRADSKSKAALVVGIGSGVALVVGVVVLLVPSSARPAQTAWNVSVTPGGVAFSGHF